MIKLVDGEEVEMTPEEEAEFLADQEKLQLPEPIRDITKRQLRIWLLVNKSKTLDDVRAAITATITDPVEREIALVELEDATMFKRSHTLFAAVGPALGFTSDEEIDEAFREAFLI